ncbi:MAG: YggT family protein [Candidatus Nanopelagicaceae bacterium]|jgi:YggT family protein
MLGIWIARFLQVFIFALFARLILDYVRMFKPSWSPRGLMLWFAESVYTFTDPPIKFFRRFIPPLRLGGVALDLSFIVLFFAVQILQSLALSFL